MYKYAKLINREEDTSKPSSLGSVLCREHILNVVLLFLCPTHLLPSVFGTAGLDFGTHFPLWLFKRSDLLWFALSSLGILNVVDHVIKTFPFRKAKPPGPPQTQVIHI
jgi:hypothetical protein